MKETQVDSDIISDPDKNLKGTLPSNKTGFLVSFLVDARGGALTGHRHWGMRVIIPPGAVQQPTRINCRYQPLSNIPFQPPFMEREALASRVIEITPAGEVFRSPVLLEIPHFASKADAEREMIVLRSEDGETWTEHVSDTVTNEEIYQDVVTSVVMKDSEDLERIYDVLEVSSGRIIRILTSKFPKYFAVVTRIREENALIGPEGGRIKLDHEPRMRVTFPKNALYKKIKVGLQVQTVKQELVQAAFGRSVEVSRLVVVEPRRRKFHQPIFISIPTSVPVTKTMSIRLLCSVTGSMEPAVWEDVTGSTPLELCKDVVHFSTKVSGIFWLLIINDQQRDAASALTVANRLYYEASLAPYLTRFSIFYRENFPRAWVNTIRIYCMTDDKAEKVIQSLQGFRPLAISNDVEVPHTSEISVKLSGNILQLKQDPFTGEMLTVSSIRSQEIKEPFRFLAFEENSLTLLVQAKDNNQSLSGNLSFSRRLTEISATQQIGLCQLPFDVQSSVVMTNETNQNGQDGFKGVVSAIESREIKETKKISQTEQPIKEDIVFTKEEPESTRNKVEEEPNQISMPKAQVEQENQYEKVGKEENPYEKIEIRKSEAFNGTVIIDQNKQKDIPVKEQDPKKTKKKESVPKDVIQKEEKGSYKGDDNKQKKKDFTSNDLDTLRRNHAKKQGVKQVEIQSDGLQTQMSGKDLEDGKESKLDNQNRLIIEPLNKNVGEEESVSDEIRRKEIEDLEEKQRQELKEMLAACPPIDPNTWRNTLFEEEQERVDKLMAQKGKEEMVTVKSNADPVKTKVNEKSMEIKGDTTTIQKPSNEEKNISTDKPIVTKTEQIENAKNLESDKVGQLNLENILICPPDKKETHNEENALIMEVDMTDWRNIAYEEEQERIDKLMKQKSVEGITDKPVKLIVQKEDDKSSQNEDHREVTKSVETKSIEDKPKPAERKIEKQASKQPTPEIPWERNLDPAIKKHIRENVFIKPSPETASKENDVIGFDIEVSKKSSTAAKIQENIPISQTQETTSKTEYNKQMSTKSESSAGKEKVKKSSFIKDWQNDIREFFRLSKVEKKKPSEASLETVEHNLHKISDTDYKTVENRSKKINEEKDMRVQSNLKSEQQTESVENIPIMLDSHTIEHIKANIFISEKPNQGEKTKTNSSDSNAKPSYVIEDMTGFRNIAYEQEQERIDKAMEIKVAELIRQNSEMETNPKSEPGSDITNKSQELSKRLETDLDESQPKILDEHTIDHIKANIFMHNEPSQTEKAEAKSIGSEEKPDYVIEDMTGFRNIAYEQEQERIDKLMKAKVDELNRQNSQLEENKQTNPISTESETKPNMKKRSKNRDRRKTNSESRNSEAFSLSESESKKNYVMEDLKDKENASSEFRSRDSSILSMGGKPKVVVPSPKGIPRPRPKQKKTGDGSNRDSIISVESLDDQQQKPAEISNIKIVESAEFQHAVESFDKLYTKQETTVTQQTTINGSSETKQTISHSSKSFESENLLQTDHNAPEASNGWKQIKRGKSFDSSENTCDKNPKDDNTMQESGTTSIPVKVQNSSDRMEESDVLHTRQDLFNLDKLGKQHKLPIVIDDIRDAYDETKLVQVLKDFQEEDSNTTKEQFSYSKVEKRTIQTSSEEPNSMMREVNVTQEGSYDDTDVIQIQRHSLTIKNDDIVQETTTIRIDPEDLASAIDPDSLKNVDGQAKQRKGSARFARKQGTRNRSQSTDEDKLSTGESQGTGDEVSSNLTVNTGDLTSSSGDLTSRLEETTQRMRKVSQVLGGEEKDMEDERPLSRTEKVVIKSDGSLPLDSVIQTMLKTPNESSEGDQADDYIQMINVEHDYEKDIHHHIFKGGLM